MVASADGEGVKRRKAILEKRKNGGLAEQLPSASVLEKDKRHKDALFAQRARRAERRGYVPVG